MANYTVPDFRLKKDLRLAVRHGETVTVRKTASSKHAEPPLNGKVMICGPMLARPYKWHTTCYVKNGVITSVQ